MAFLRGFLIYTEIWCIIISGDVMEGLKKELAVFSGALLCCFLWASAVPSIKIGYKLWDIGGNETWKVIRFAGIRFFLAGILVIAFAGAARKKLLIPRRDEWGKVMFLSLFQTIGQYIFFYIGVAHTTGVNSAVVDSLTNFFAIIIASVVLRMEKLTVRKMAGCLLGLAGVVLVEITPAGFEFRPAGDGLVALSALCYGVSSSMIKRYSSEHDTVLFSGWQFIFGGAVMTAVGQCGMMVSGGGSDDVSRVSFKAVALLIYLALVSSVAYTLWGILLKNNDVSKISVFGFMNPVMGVMLSAVLLGEAGQLGIKYAAALLLIGAGIATVNLKKRHETNDTLNTND